MSYNTRNQAGMRFFRPSNQSGYSGDGGYKPRASRGAPVVPQLSNSTQYPQPNRGGPNPAQSGGRGPVANTNPPPVPQRGSMNENNSPSNASPAQDPSNYTQPAYSTQTAFVSQQPSPKQPAPAPAPAAQATPPPPPPPLQPVTAKDVVMTSADESVGSPTSEEINTTDQLEKGPRPPMRPWNRKGPGFNFRISKKIRRRRQNARLRHILAPKNAMMVLHELHPELKLIATEQLNAAGQMVYTVDIEIEGKKYSGHGMSKLAAKQLGCENALKAVLLEKMAKNNTKPTQELPKEPESVKVEGETEPSEEAMEDEEATPPVRRQWAEDDFPWGSLASFALYKLFSEWQSQGFQLPPTTSLTPLLQKPTQVTVSPMKKIPDDANQKHPVQLLNQLRPGCQYSETREGTPPNLSFTFTAVVDGQTFHGVGNSKKEAKKQCAKAALQSMGVNYD